MAKAKRKKIATSVRFEVFKRDSFTCQYCGRKAPEVVLELEHIDPVSKGGGNEILNLVTSCWACNSGKGDRKLDDDTVVAKQHAQLAELQERREQLDMMLRWRDANLDLEAVGLDAFAKAYQARVPGWSLNESGLSSARDLIGRFGLSRALEALDSASIRVVKIHQGKATQDSAGKVIGAAFINAEPPDVQRLYKIRLRIKSRWNYVHDGRCIGLLRRLLALGPGILEIEYRTFALVDTQYTSFTQWVLKMEEWEKELRGQQR